MGSVECAAKRVGHLIKALFRKYIRCLFANGFKFMDISLSHVLSSLLPLPLPHNISRTYALPLS